MVDSRTPARPEAALAKMIASLKERTGKSIEEWSSLVAASAKEKHAEIVAWLKAEHGLTHGYAHQIALHLRKAGAPESTTHDPIAALFEKRPEARRVYDVLMPQLSALGPDVDAAPKKGYLSLRRAKQFAMLQPAAGRLDVGLVLKGVSPQGRLEASGSFNAMMTHRVRLASPEDVDAEVLSWLRTAYDAA